MLSPLAIPAYEDPWIRSFNSWFLRQQVLRAMRSLDFQRPINWVFNPAACLVAGALGEDMLIYYCVDEYAAFSDVERDSLASMERDLLDKADMVIASSDRLFQSKRLHNPRTRLVRHGVDWAHFRGAFEQGHPGAARAGIAAATGPGLLRAHRRRLGRRWSCGARRPALPHVSIVMLGKITMDVSALRRFPNVHLLGRKPYEVLPSYCAGFDAAMIPFPLSEVTLNANPLKAREYLAAGLPVVSTAIPEVEVLGACRIADGPDAFVTHVEAALAERGPSAARSDAIQHESWGHDWKK